MRTGASVDRSQASKQRRPPRAGVGHLMLAALRYLLSGTRGGTERVRTLGALDEQPRDPEQLAAELDLDHVAVRHHLEVLEANGAVATADDERTGYHLTNQALADWDEIQALVDRTEDQNAPELEDPAR